MKENQRIRLTKKLLKESLLRLLKKKELSKINITELCNDCEINRATFYRHYAVPKDILLDVQKDFINELYEATKHIKTETDAEKYLEHLCLFFYEHSTLVRCFTENNLGYDIELLLSQFFQSILKTQNKFGDNTDETRVTIFNAYLSGGAYSVLRKWINGEIIKTPKDIARITLKLLNGDFAV